MRGIVKRFPGVTALSGASLSLRAGESRELFAIVERLRADGIGVIYISHRMDDVLSLADRIAVLRDGRHVGELARAEATHDRIVTMMVGRELSGPLLPGEERARRAPARRADAAAHRRADDGEREERGRRRGRRRGKRGDRMRRELGMSLVLVLMCAGLWISNPDFLGQSNVVNTTRQIAMLGIFAMGMGLVIITGGIDLSIGSVIGLTGVLLAKISSPGMGCLGYPLWVGIHGGARRRDAGGARAGAPHHAASSCSRSSSRSAACSSCAASRRRWRRAAR